MLHYQDNEVKSRIFEGKIGLEKESLRVTPDGFLAKTPHPFKGNPNIVRDFCENQVEINTTPEDSPQKAVEQLFLHTKYIRDTLKALDEPELLWTFSNPPYIRNEEDIPIAQYEGVERQKTEYREYLADRYGRYKMTFSGIHYNYSFSEELLKASYQKDGTKESFLDYKNQFYVDLAAKVQEYNWLVVAVTAASPLLV